MPTVLPNAAPPGSLADAVVGADTFRKMRRPERVEIVTFTPLPPQDGAPQWKEHTTPLLPNKTTPVASALAALLRTDALYIGDPTDLVNAGDVEIRLCDPLPNTRVALFLKKHRIQFLYDRKNVGYWQNLLLDPIGKRLLEIVQENAATDERVRRLRFAPLPPRPAKIPPGIPPDILRGVCAVRPGMRRTDVLRILREQGGISSRFSRQYVYPKPINRQGLIAKVDIAFVPATTRIRWIGGVGYPIDPYIESTARSGQEQNSDIVVKVSEPFLGYGIVR